MSRRSQAEIRAAQAEERAAVAEADAAEHRRRFMLLLDNYDAAIANTNGSIAALGRSIEALTVAVNKKIPKPVAAKAPAKKPATRATKKK